MGYFALLLLGLPFLFLGGSGSGEEIHPEDLGRPISIEQVDLAPPTGLATSDPVVNQSTNNNNESVEISEPNPALGLFALGLFAVGVVAALVLKRKA